MIVSREDVTTTRLIHRAYRGAMSWWHSAAVCDLPGAFGRPAIMDLLELLSQIRRMGFDAILLRLSMPNVEDQRDTLRHLVDRAHQENLKIIVRVGAAPDGQVLKPTVRPQAIELDDDPSLLVSRTRQLVKLGVDGVDLGTIDDDPDNPESVDRAEGFSQTVNRQLAEVADADAESTIILTAEAIRSNTAFFERHVTEEWFHHLRDDALFHSPWNANELARRIRVAYSTHDPLGQVVAWRPSRGACWSPAATDTLALSDAWADRVPEQRFNAMMTFVAGLPGSIYLPFLQCGGYIQEEDGDGSTELRVSLGRNHKDRFQSDLTRRILGLRAQRKLALGTLAKVEGLDWAPSGVAVHLSGHLMAVLNASDQDVLVPAAQKSLTYSDGFFETTETATVVAPNTCAWFIPS